MVTVINKNPTTFGRFLTGAAQGLSEQLPKEIERKRLSEGLQELESQSENLSPFQQYSRLLTLPGMTPQGLQGASDLLKQQGMRKAYANKASQLQDQGMPGGKQPAEQDFKNVQFANLQNRPQGAQAGRSIPSDINEPGQPQILEKNPLREEALPAKPWSFDRKIQEMDSLGKQFPNATLQELSEMARESEQRALAMPQAEREQDEYLKTQQIEADNEFDKQLQLKLQKDTEGVFKDVTGEMINNMKRGIARDLRTNPKSNVKDVVNDWTNRALDLAKTKSQLSQEAGTNLFATPLLLNKGVLHDKLKSYQKIFDKTGNKEEYYNTLQSDFGLSAQGAASIAYPKSKKVSEYLNQERKTKGIDYKNVAADSRKQAADVAKLITPEDSLLAIARDLRKKNPLFDERAFFNQLRSDQEDLGLTPRQQRELASGESGLLPSWADVLILPWTR